MSGGIVIELPRRRPVDTPRQAIRALLMNAVYHPTVERDRATITVPLDVLERLTVAALTEESSS